MLYCLPCLRVKRSDHLNGSEQEQYFANLVESLYGLPKQWLTKQSKEQSPDFYDIQHATPLHSLFKMSLKIQHAWSVI